MSGTRNTRTYTNWHRRRILRRVERKFGTRYACAKFLADSGRYTFSGASTLIYGLTSTSCECAYFNETLYQHLLEIC